MARAKSFSPKYRPHISGNARVTLDGETFYLGKYNSPESWARYHSLLLEYQRNGLTVPESTPRLPDDLPEILVRDITADFRGWLSSLPGKIIGSFLADSSSDPRWKNTKSSERSRAHPVKQIELHLNTARDVVTDEQRDAMQNLADAIRQVRTVSKTF